MISLKLNIQKKITIIINITFKNKIVVVKLCFHLKII